MLVWFASNDAESVGGFFRWIKNGIFFTFTLVSMCGDWRIGEMKRILFTSLLVLGLLAVSGCKEKPVVADSAGADGVAVVADDGSVVLVLEDDPMPVGAVLETTFSMEMEDGKITLTLPDRVMEGATTSKETKKQKIEGLAPHKIRNTLIMKEKTQQTTMAGNEQPPQTSSDPMVGIPVIMEEGDDGKWTATLESGEVTPEIAKELEKLIKSKSEENDKRIYGTVPRKVGDEWVVTGDDLLGIDDSTGTFNVKLEAIEDYMGERCAKITGTMDVEGSGPADDEEVSGMKMRTSGAFTVYRSLEHRVDVSNELTGKMEVSGDLEPQPGIKMKMKMAGAMKMTGKAVVTMPK